VSVLVLSVLGCGSVATTPGGGQDAAAGATGAAGAGAAGAGQAGASAAGSSGEAGVGAAGAGNVGGGLGGAGGATSPAAPGPFMLKTPLNGDPTASTTPMLTWDASPGALSYVVEIATEPTFAADVQQKSGITTASFALTDALQPGVVYYWRVGAVPRSRRRPSR
jgi:hypothetical protein